jgi:YD repeat-containing protein
LNTTAKGCRLQSFSRRIGRARKSFAEAKYDSDGDLQSLSFPQAPYLDVTPNLDQFDRVTGYSSGSETVNYGFTGNNTYPDSATRAYAGGPSTTVGYSYYDDFNRNTMSTPMGTFSYGHDANGNTANVTDPSGASAGYQWSPDGLLTQLSHASGGATVDTTTYFYNSLDMPTDVKTVAVDDIVKMYNCDIAKMYHSLK